MLEWSPPMRIGVAGTFNRFHIGHRVLLDRVLLIKQLFPYALIDIGITTDAFASLHRTVLIRGEEERMQDVVDYLHKNGVEHSDMKVWFIREPYGVFTDDIDILVVSEETVFGANQLIADRIARGIMKPLSVSVVPEMCFDGERISSTSIIREETNPNNKYRGPYMKNSQSNKTQEDEI